MAAYTPTTNMGAARVYIFGERNSTHTSYDAQSRVDVLTYPSGLAVKHHYDEYSNLNRVSNVASGLVYWQADYVDALGNVALWTQGNGITGTRVVDQATNRVTAILAGSTSTNSDIQSLHYQWDAVGNLRNREDQLQNGLIETFTYDSLNRLETVKRNGVPSLGMAYDAVGNITDKDDVGNYEYLGGPANGVSAVTGNTPAQYYYDANGNRIWDELGTRHRYNLWTSYNKPRLIGIGAGSDAFNQRHLASTSFWLYGPERQRFWSYHKNQNAAGDVTEHTYIGYVGQHYEVHGDALAQSATQKHYIRAGNTVVAEHIIRSNQTEAVHYLQRDHLGSVDAITSQQGDVIQRSSFDAFGKRRQADWTPDGLNGQLFGAYQQVSNRGYTGHEQLDNLGLIHMNGRVYDPVLGRFLSADPFVQFPESTQGINRYSYVNNNPLSYTDPSGFFLELAFKPIRKLYKSIGRWVKNNWRTVAAVAISFIPGGAHVGIAMLQGFAAGEVSALTG